MKKNRAVITGFGALTPLGLTAPETWDNLEALKQGIDKLVYFDSGGYRTSMGGEILDPALHEEEKRSPLDRASILALRCADETIASAGLGEGMKCDVVLGTTLGGMRTGENYYKALIESGEKPLNRLIEFIADSPALNIVRKYRLTGKDYTLSSACASGTLALNTAYDLIRSGESVRVLAGGYEPLSRMTFGGFSSLQNISSGRCKPFDKSRDGLSLGEGAGMVMMESPESAAGRNTRIHGEVMGCGNNSDAYHITSPDPEGASAAAAMKKALESASLRPSDIDWINAHGTGTVDSDVMEATAIRNVFGEYADSIPVSSLKSYFGHLLGASGSVEAVISLMALEKGVILPTLNLDQPDPECGLHHVLNRPLKKELRYILSNSFGFGGANASVVLGMYIN